jgi:hypothetical protein
MFRVSLANAFAHRTLRPLMEKHQATPFPGTLVSTESKDIYSGMVATFDTNGLFKVADNTTTGAALVGLFALDKNPTINDLDGQPTDFSGPGTSGAGTPFAVWQGGPDAYFRIDDPAFNKTGTLAVGTKLFVDSNGKLAASDATGTIGTAVAAIVAEVTSATRLVIRIALPVTPLT